MSQTYTMGNNLMGYLFSGTSYTPPTNWYIGLSTTTITQSGTGVTEPLTSAGYARIAVPRGVVYFSSPSNGTVTNIVELTFPISTADWGVITDFALFESAVATTPLIYGKLTSSKTVQSGTVLVIAVGAMEMTQTNIA